MGLNPQPEAETQWGGQRSVSNRGCLQRREVRLQQKRMQLASCLAHQRLLSSQAAFLVAFGEAGGLPQARQTKQPSLAGSSSVAGPAAFSAPLLSHRQPELSGTRGSPVHAFSWFYWPYWEACRWNPVPQGAAMATSGGGGCIQLLIDGDSSLVGLP